MINLPKSISTKPAKWKCNLGTEFNWKLFFKNSSLQLREVWINLGSSVDVSTE